MSQPGRKGVVVCTEHRGVFFGYVTLKYRIERIVFDGWSPNTGFGEAEMAQTRFNTEEEAEHHLRQCLEIYKVAAWERSRFRVCAVPERDDDKKTISLDSCRMCVYWSAETRGVLGLASTGPAAGSRITPSVEKADLNAVTCVLDCKDEATIQWERGIWS